MIVDKHPMAVFEVHVRETFAVPAGAREMLLLGSRSIEIGITEGTRAPNQKSGATTLPRRELRTVEGKSSDFRSSSVDV